MIEPTEKDIGRVVLYQGGHPDDKDRGVITSFNERVVFVRYGSKQTSQATSRCDLTWEHNQGPALLGGAAGFREGGRVLNSNTPAVERKVNIWRVEWAMSAEGRWWPQAKVFLSEQEAEHFAKEARLSRVATRPRRFNRPPIQGHQHAEDEAMTARGAGQGCGEAKADQFDGRLYALISSAEEIAGSGGDQQEQAWCDKWCDIISDLEAVRLKVREMMSARDRKLPQEPLT